MKRVGLLAGLLVLALGVGATSWPVLAQTPQPDDGLTVEVPGFPLRFQVPSTWEVSEARDLVPYPFTSGSAFHVVVSVAAKDPATDARCGLAAYMSTAEPGPISVPDETRRRHADADDMEVFSPWEEVPLGFGPATRWDADAYDRQWTWYLASDGVDLYSLLCGASEAKADRWLSVASTMERRPVAEHAMLNMDAGRFVPAGSLAEARDAHTATLLSDGRVLVVGGLSAEAPPEFSDSPNPSLTSAEVWDQTTEEFSSAGELVDGRYFHTATLLTDGRVLVVGGYGSSQATDVLASAEVWDPVTGEFAPTGSLSQARAAHTASLLPDGRVLVIGGAEGGDDSVDCVHALSSGEAWDPVTGEFTIVGYLDKSRQEHFAASQPDGRVLVLGGTDDCWNPSPSKQRRVVEAWDPAAMDGFGRAGFWDDARLLGTTTVLADGRVMVAGGVPDLSRPIDEWGDPTDIRAWDPTNGQSNAAGSLVQSRDWHTATLLTDGRVLVVGGGYVTQGGSVTFASAEVWDPATEESRLTGGLSTPRTAHTATALPDGRVLVAGGFNRDGHLPEAEIWEPSQ